jgi:hypothetical protein
MRLKALAYLATLSLTAIALSPAQAAPQILGLMATTAPVPITCMNGTCTAELSSVCLQEHRPTPSTGTAYRPAQGTEIILTVAGIQGSLRVEAALSFTSLRQYTAVKVSLPEATVRQLGNGAASLSVSPKASIIPITTANDSNPLSAAEIARYTGPLRAMAESAFERDGDRVKATGILNRMVNRLPESSTAGIEELASLREETVGEGAAAGTQQYIARAVENCRETLRVGMMADLRSCLSYQHDYLAGENTTNGWQAMNPGS